jgi:hypothetical protein
VADFVGVSWQKMRELMPAHSDCFPVPVHEGSVDLARCGRAGVVASQPYLNLGRVLNCNNRKLLQYCLMRCRGLTR